VGCWWDWWGWWGWSVLRGGYYNRGLHGSEISLLVVKFLYISVAWFEQERQEALLLDVPRDGPQLENVPQPARHGRTSGHHGSAAKHGRTSGHHGRAATLRLAARRSAVREPSWNEYCVVA